MSVYDAPADEGEGAPRQSYNFAPGYHGIVYRADTPDWGAGPARDQANDKSGGPPQNEVRYRLQCMKWGLVPSWAKRKPDYASLMRTINCRDDSLSTPGGMWATMKARKRCVVIAEGFYEWLRVGPKERVPHYVKRKDGQLLLLAGLWDCVQYESGTQGSDEKLYTYTIITTDSNPQLKFLHDRMPVILEPASAELKSWLSPTHHEWTRDLQRILRPFSGELDVYPVTKDVGKVGNNSPSFIIPVNSKENKSNIANFFTPGVKRKASTPPPAAISPSPKKHQAPAPVPLQSPLPAKHKLSATSNGTKSPSRVKSDASQKITKFFKNPA
jgi:putative SOS response-associated peptidase YedK